jgi:hypothetical protein
MRRSGEEETVEPAPGAPDSAADGAQCERARERGGGWGVGERRRRSTSSRGRVRARARAHPGFIDRLTMSGGAAPHITAAKADTAELASSRSSSGLLDSWPPRRPSSGRGDPGPWHLSPRGVGRGLRLLSRPPPPVPELFRFSIFHVGGAQVRMRRSRPPPPPPAPRARIVPWPLRLLATSESLGTLDPSALGSNGSGFSLISLKWPGRYQKKKKTKQNKTKHNRKKRKDK